MTLFLSSSSFNYKDLNSFLLDLKDYKLINIEFSGGFNFQKDYLINLTTFIHNNFNNKFLFHNYFVPKADNPIINIIDPDTNNRKRSIEYIKNGIEIAAKNNLSLFSFHAGFTSELTEKSKDGYFNYKKINEKSLFINIFIESMNEILKYAKQYNIKIAIENCFPISKNENYSFLTTFEDYELISKLINDNNFGYVLDLGHLNVTSYYLNLNVIEETKKIISKFKNKIFEIHLSSNSGKKDDGLLPKKDSWEIKIINYYNLNNIPITLELKDLTFKMAEKIFLEYNDLL